METGTSKKSMRFLEWVSQYCLEIRFGPTQWTDVKLLCRNQNCFVRTSDSLSPLNSFGSIVEDL
jgi:hypothetical protein